MILLNKKNYHVVENHVIEIHVKQGTTVKPNHTKPRFALKEVALNEVTVYFHTFKFSKENDKKHIYLSPIHYNLVFWSTKVNISILLYKCYWNSA